VGVLPAGVTFSASTLTYTFFGLTTPGVYTFTVQGDNLIATSDSATFTVTVTAIPAPTVIPNTGPPYFSPALADINIDVGKSQAFKFPSFLDPDKSDTPLFVSMNIGTASGFVTGSFPNLMIAPTKSP